MRTALLCLVLVACSDAREQAETAKAKVVDTAQFGLKAKSELDKVYKTTSDYDLELSSDAVDDAGMKTHEAKIAAMPNVKIGDLTVGYEESQERSLRGQTYAKHFRATWVKDGKKVGVGYYSREEIDAVAFAALLQKLVPAVQVALR